MDVTIQICCDGKGFEYAKEHPQTHELARLLRVLADTVEPLDATQVLHQRLYPIHDINGDWVGKMEVVD